MERLHKRFSSLLLCAAMVFTMLPSTLAYAAEAAPARTPKTALQTLLAAGETAYVGEDGGTDTAQATPIDSTTTTLTNGWYVVKGDVTISNTVTVSGDVKLILADGCTLKGSTWSSYINVAGDNRLTIYGQANGTGQINVNGISGGDGSSGGTVTINGGMITVANSSNGAGIGGGESGSGGTVTINGGTVTATATSSSGAGIGGGMIGSGGTVTINGGTVTATSYGGGAGIGGGMGGSGGTVTINGGTVTATGSGGGAGIGGGMIGSSGTVTINGGTVTATGSGGGAGIGGGINNGGGENAGVTVITGGSVNADIQNTPTNGSTNGNSPLLLTKVSLPSVNTATGVTALTTGTGYYGTNGVYTDSSGKLYLWLPSGAAVTAVETATLHYPGSIFAGTAGTLGTATPRPEITSVSVPASGVYGAGKNLDFVVNFDGAVTVNSADGTPYLPLTVGGSTVKASYLSGSGTSALTFRYTVAPNDSDTGGVALGNAITLNGGSIQSAQGANALLVCHNAEPTSNVLVDTVAPTVTAVTPSGTDVSVGTGSLSVTFSKAMDTTFSIVALNGTPMMNPSWDAAHKTVTYALPGLAYHTTYSVLVFGFMDTAGNIMLPYNSPFITAPKSLTDAMVADIATQTYTGSAIEPGITVTDGAATLTEGTDYTISYSGNTVAGTAAATVMGTGSYAGKVQKTFTIGPKAIALTLAASPQDTANAGSNVTLTASVSGAVDLPQGTVTFRDGNTVIAQNVPITGSNSKYSAQTIWSNVSDGSHNLTAEYAPASSGENYSCSAAATLSGYSAAKRNQSGFGFPSSTVSKTYGDADFAVTASDGQGSGAITYASSDAGIATVEADTGKVHIKKAGSVTITASKAADSNYNAATATMTITVGKAAARITTLPATGNITVVGKLSSSTLTGGKGSVDGSFEWSNPDTVVTSSGEYEVTFMPKDTDDYLPCTGKVQVTVSPNLTGCSGEISLDLTGVTLPVGVTSVSLGSSQSDTGSTEYTAIFKLISGDASLGNLKNLVLYDLKLLDQKGNPIENFTGKIKVKVKIPSGMSGDLHVYWYDSADNKLVDVDATQEDGYLLFYTTHFSFYAITQLGASSPPVTNPKTGSENWPFIPLALLGGSSATMLMAIRKKRGKGFRRKANKV